MLHKCNIVTVKTSLMDSKNPSSDDRRRGPPLLNWTILSRSQEMLSGLNSNT